MNILELLVNKNIIKRGDISKIEKAVGSEGKTTEDVLGTMGISSETVLDAMGEYYNIPTRNLDGQEIPFAVLKNISEDSAQHYSFVPIAVKSSGSINCSTGFAVSVFSHPML